MQDHIQSSNIIIICCDVTNPQSFLNLPSHLEKIKQCAPEDAIIYIVATKVDPDLGEQRKVSREELENIALENNYTYLETSARDDDNIGVNTLVENLFEHANNKNQEKSLSNQKIKLPGKVKLEVENTPFNNAANTANFYNQAYEQVKQDFDNAQTEKEKIHLITFTKKLNAVAESYKTTTTLIANHKTSVAEYRQAQNKNLAISKIKDARKEVDDNRKILTKQLIELDHSLMTKTQVIIDAVASFIGAVVCATGLACFGAAVAGSASLVTGPAAIVVAPPAVIAGVGIGGVIGAALGGFFGHKFASQRIHAYNHDKEIGKTPSYKEYARAFAGEIDTAIAGVQVECNKQEGEELNEGLGILHRIKRSL